MHTYFIMLTNDNMAVAATLVISFTESFNLISKVFEIKENCSVNYDSLEDSKETRVEYRLVFRSLSALSLPTYIAISLYISKIVPILLRRTRGLVFWSEKENISVLMCDLPNYKLLHSH